MKVRISWPGENDIEPLVKALATMSGLRSDGVEATRCDDNQFICFVRDFGSMEYAQSHIVPMQETIHRLLGRCGEVLLQEKVGDEFKKVA